MRKNLHHRSDLERRIYKLEERISCLGDCLCRMSLQLATISEQQRQQYTDQTIRRLKETADRLKATADKELETILNKKP